MIGGWSKSQVMSGDAFKPSSSIATHPDHYTHGGIEAIDYMAVKLTPEQFQGYCIGNVIKYASRFRHKDGIKDLEKAKDYLNWAIESWKTQTNLNTDPPF